MFWTVLHVYTTYTNEKLDLIKLQRGEVKKGVASLTNSVDGADTDILNL
jgi:hypothetical protein